MIFNTRRSNTEHSEVTRSSATAEIARDGCHYAVYSHSRILMLLPIKSPYATTYWWITLTYIVSCTVSKL